MSNWYKSIPICKLNLVPVKKKNNYLELDFVREKKSSLPPWHFLKAIVLGAR